MRQLFTIILIATYSGVFSQNQMKNWEYNTFKKAEKARKWRSKQSRTKIWKPKPRQTPSRSRKKFRYGQPTTIRHKGVR